MRSRSANYLSVIFLFFCISIFPKTEISAQNSLNIVLPKPNMEGGKPLKEVLKLRHSSRQYSAENIPLQTLSDLLWAAWGINREDSAKRTAPSMGNRQTIDVYVVISKGLYLYDARENTLKTVHGKDIRALIGRQSFIKEAPVNLIYVADLTRMGKIKNEQKMFLSAADTGYISQNVYLFCASEELATVVFHNIYTAVLEKEMRLRPEQKIILAQSVGYPQKQK